MIGTLSNIHHQHFISLSSTNTKATEYLADIEPGTLLLISAEEQTAGKGRFNRNWHSPAGLNLYSTYGFLVEKKRSDIGNIPQIMALTITEILKLHRLQPKLKWPNDVLIGDKKICGVLAETFSLPDSGFLYMIIGVGLNINMPLAETKEIKRQITSVYLETGELIDLALISRQLSTLFLKNYNLYIENGFFPFLKIYQDQMFLQKNDPISFHVHGSLIHGTFQEITSNGTLKIQMLDGKISEFVSGEIE